MHVLHSVHTIPCCVCIIIFLPFPHCCCSAAQQDKLAEIIERSEAKSEGLVEEMVEEESPSSDDSKEGGVEEISTSDSECK